MQLILDKKKTFIKPNKQLTKRKQTVVKSKKRKKKKKKKQKKKKKINTVHNLLTFSIFFTKKIFFLVQHFL